MNHFLHVAESLTLHIIYNVKGTFGPWNMDTLNARQTDTFEKINRTCFGINDLSLQRTLDPSCI